MHYVFGQNPAHYKIGEDEFSNVHIYSLFNDDLSHRLYCATDNGLYVSHGSSFTQIKKNPKQKGASLFDIQRNPSGKIYCKNLRGQLFSLNNDNKLELVYELPETRIGVSFWYFFSGDQLWLITNHTITSYPYINGKYDFKNGRQHAKELMQNATIENCSIVSETESILSLNRKGEIVTINNGLLSIETLDLPIKDRSFFRLNNKTYTADIFGSVTEINSKTKLNSYEYNEWFQQLNKSLVVGRCQKNGVHFITSGKEKKPYKYFTENFISAVSANQNGTIFLGTFNEGIIVIPSLSARQFDFDRELLTSITMDDNECYVSTRSGKVISIQDHEISTVYEGRENFDLLYMSPLSNGEIKNAPKIIHLPSLNIVNPKDAWVIDEHSTLVAQYDRLVLITDGKNNRTPKNIGDAKNIYNLVLEKRFTSVAYSHSEDQIYYANNKGFFVRDYTTGLDREIKYKGQSLIVSDIYCLNDQTWVATQESGLLLFKGGTLVRLYDENSTLKANKIKKIKQHNGMLYVLTINGLAALNSASQEFYYFGLNDGILNPSVSDFDLNQDKLYLMYRHHVVVIPVPTKKNASKFHIAPIVIDSIEVNGRKRDLFKAPNLSYQENSVIIHFDSRAIETRTESQIYYRLSPLNENWILIKNLEAENLNFNALSDGSYTFQLKTSFNDQESFSETLHFVIDKPFWRKWWFTAGIIMLLLALISLYYKRILRLQRIRLETINEINASKITAIQSQMNPHFIFNALNSIQALVLKGDVDNSYGFINKFSLLMRRTLTNSGKDCISLDEEIDLLTNYLELEKLRFREDFEYRISNNIEDEIYIPPMLLQPFVENSIIHGLLPKEGFKSLSIVFSSYDNTIECIIEDNGIGRMRAKEISNRRMSDHDSFATKSINNRLNLLKKKYGTKLGYQYDDLVDENRNTIGTRLTVIIPQIDPLSK